MNIKPIRTEQDYQEALEIVSAIFDNQPQERGLPNLIK